MGIDDLILQPISVGWLVIKAHICILIILNTMNRSNRLNVHPPLKIWFNSDPPLSVESRTNQQTNESKSIFNCVTVQVILWYWCSLLWNFRRFVTISHLPDLILKLPKKFERKREKCQLTLYFCQRIMTDPFIRPFDVRLERRDQDTSSSAPSIQHGARLPFCGTPGTWETQLTCNFVNQHLS